MKSIIKRYSFLAVIFTLLSVNQSLCQIITDDTPFIEEKTGFNPEESLKKIEKAILLNQKRSLTRQETALQNVYDAIIDKQDLKKTNFNWGEIFIKAIVSTGASVADQLKKTSVFGFAYSVVEGIYNQQKEQEKLEGENIKIRERNDLIRLFGSYRTMNTYAIEDIEDKEEEGVVYKALLKRYKELPANSERVKYLEDLRKDVDRVRNNLPNIKSLQLVYYKKILEAMYTSKNGGTGYIKILVDYTQGPKLDKWVNPENLSPSLVKISLEAGTFSKRLEKEINALIQSGSVKEKSILELTDIPQKVFVKFNRGKLYNVTTVLPITYWKGLEKAPWKSQDTRFKGRIICVGFEVIATKRLLELQANLYKDKFLAPYKYLKKNRRSYNKFAAY